MHASDVMIALWGLLGGLFRSLSIAVSTGTPPAIVHVVANVLISGFCGYLAAKVAGTLDPDWITVAAGAGGYLGTQTIDLLISAAQRGRDAS